VSVGLPRGESKNGIVAEKAPLQPGTVIAFSWWIGAPMSYPKIRIVAPAEVRQALTSEGDIRSEIAFQNDINRLLAWFEEFPFPLCALAEIEP
jgi:hypothetical protein